MCPKVVASCCTPADQHFIFAKWIKGQEKKNIDRYYQQNQRVYLDLVATLGQVQDLASVIKSNIVKTVANCKLISERML